MQVPYDQGLANQVGPAVCDHVREGMSEASLRACPHYFHGISSHRKGPDGRSDPAAKAVGLGKGRDEPDGPFLCGTESWQFISSDTDAAGRVYRQVGTYDNGTGCINQWDPQGRFDWTRSTDAAGQNRTTSKASDMLDWARCRTGKRGALGRPVEVVQSCFFLVPGSGAGPGTPGYWV
jgi:hypothetical protein